jgi:hypothetical protein
LACNLTATAGRTAHNPSAAGSQAAPEEAATAGVLPEAAPTVLPSYGRMLCAEKPSMAAILADPALVSAIRAGLDRYETDLCDDGYGVVERTLDFASPPDLRAYLADLFQKTHQALEGAIFLGTPLFASQYVRPESNNPDSPASAEEAVSFQYYSDLDGEFSASPEYRSPGKHQFSFNRHTGEVDWEIWIGILPHCRGDKARAEGAWNRYFEKKHRYRPWQSSIPEAFLYINEHYTAVTASDQADFVDSQQTGEYAWTPLSNQPTARIYFDGPTLSVMDGYADLSAGAADITVTETHGNYESSGRIDIRWVESQPVRTLLYWTDGCSVGDFKYEENFLASIVFSRTGEVLAARGSTNDSGGLGPNREGFYGHNIAVRLSAGMNLGWAILGHVNVPLISHWAEGREFHFAMVIPVGDPALRFRG